MTAQLSCGVTRSSVIGPVDIERAVATRVVTAVAVLSSDLKSSPSAAVTVAELVLGAADVAWTTICTACLTSSESESSDRAGHPRPAGGSPGRADELMPRGQRVGRDDAGRGSEPTFVDVDRVGQLAVDR